MILINEAQILLEDLMDYEGWHVDCNFNQCSCSDDNCGCGL